MKIISEKTGKEYATVAECQDAEALYDAEVARKEKEKARKNEERSARAKEVEDAYKRVLEAQKEYRHLLNTFCKDYGSFHMTLKDGNSFFDSFFNIF